MASHQKQHKRRNNSRRNYSGGDCATVKHPSPDCASEPIDQSSAQQDGSTCTPPHRNAQFNRTPNSASRNNRGKDHTPKSTPNRQYTPRNSSGRTRQTPESGQYAQRMMFEPYWTQEDLQHGLKTGEVVQGTLRVNTRNYEDSYVPHPDGASDVYIQGVRFRNRAFNGDVVAVHLLPKLHWKVDMERLEYKIEELSDIFSTLNVESKPDAQGSATMQTENTMQRSEDVRCEVPVSPRTKLFTDPVSPSAQTLATNSANQSNTLESAANVSESLNSTSVNAEAARNPSAQEAVQSSASPSSGTPGQITSIQGGVITASLPVHTPTKYAQNSSERKQQEQSTPNHNAQTPSRQSRGLPGRNISNSPATPQKTSTYVTLGELCHPDFNLSHRFRDLFSSRDNPPELINQRLDAIPPQLLQRTGKVVAILTKGHSRACTGYISLQPNRNATLFRPVDSRIPRVVVPIEDCPPDFVTRPDIYETVMFIARIIDWQDGPYAYGRLQRSLGEAGQVEPETEGMLVENGIDFAEFPKQVLACLPRVSEHQPWQIPASELAARRDLREECIFTIDPASARDLDDALHCKLISPDVYEVGVHIADVSYFVTPDNAIDEVAASRATSVYLVQRVIPMLPRVLCEQLCSLNPDEDRLAFSVIWHMRTDGTVLDEWFGRSVIRTVTKLSYDHAQGFIEDPEREFTQDELPTIASQASISQIREGVLNLHQIAQNLRARRFENGALALNQVKLGFLLSKETGLPCGFNTYRQRDSNRLVEEFMLLANMAVAHKIYKHFPEIAVLRRHPEPQDKMLDDLTQICEALGVPMNVHTSKLIQESLLAQDAIDEGRMQILTAMLSKPMQLAQYFCTGSEEDEDKYRHYALCVPLYTHFTSPIRRYPDIMVHRLLAAALGIGETPDDSVKTLSDRCNHCNDMKRKAKLVGDLSSEMFFAVFVKESGRLEQRGMVMGVLDRSFDVYLLDLGIVKRVRLDDLRPRVKTYNFCKERGLPILTLQWVAEGTLNAQTQEIRIFTPVACVILPEDQPLKWKVVIKHPEETSEVDGSPELQTTQEAIQPETNFSYEDL